MKKHLLTIIAAGAFTGSMFAQLPVSTSPQNRKVVLEEFTGIYCQYCPDGHKIANEIKASKPAGDVVLINIHTGGYANNTGTDPDYKTAEGNAIAAIPGMGITGYPTGSLNRHVWTGSSMAMSRSAWATYATTCLAQPSPVNVAAQGTVDVNTRVLTVKAEVYYTANSSASTNSLTIALLENWVVGPQTAGATWYPAMVNNNGTYNHQHMLRKVLTSGNFGIPVSPTTAGSSFSVQLTYTVPTTFGIGTGTNACNINNIEVVAFVADDYKEIRTACYGPLTFLGMANTLDVNMNWPALQSPPKTFITDAQVCDAKFNSTFQFHNSGSATATNVVFGYQVNGGAVTNFTWTGSVAANQQSGNITVPTITFTPLANNNYSLSVVSVNGGSDGNATNNLLYKNNIPKTTLASNYPNMQMDFLQDQWGTECSWKLYDESNMSIVAQDGPWSNLGGAGTLNHPMPFTVSPNKCYKLAVTDTYGDGVNSGSGAGGYTVKSNGVNLIISAGTFGYGENKWWITPVNLGVGSNASNVSGINLYPNPANNNANLSFELSQNETVNVVVLNNLGQVVYSQNAQNFEAGSHNIPLNTANLASGIYNVNVTTSAGTVNHKLTVTK